MRLKQISTQVVQVESAEQPKKQGKSKLMLRFVSLINNKKVNDVRSRGERNEFIGSCIEQLTKGIRDRFPLVYGKLHNPCLDT